MLSFVWKSNKALALWLGFEISTENLNPPIPKTPILLIVQCNLEHFGGKAFASPLVDPGTPGTVWAFLFSPWGRGVA